MKCQQNLNNKPTFDATKDFDTTVFEIGEYINTHEPIFNTSMETYTNRGGDRDRFWSEVARRNKICFVWGWSGIGKSLFVEVSVAEKLKKRRLHIKLTRGHSLDRLCREVIDVCREKPQPISDTVNESILLYEAMNALRKRSDKFFLFLDDAEHALDTGNTLHTYLETFLQKFLELEIDTWIVLATTRSPDIFDDLVSRNANIFRLGQLSDDDVEESIERWLSGSEDVLREAQKSSEHWLQLIELIEGYPLAINFVSLTLLAGKKPVDIINDSGRRAIQQRAARSILKTFSKDVMNEDHQNLLFALSAINHPVGIDDLRSIMFIRTKPLSEIQKCREELLTWRLIESHLDTTSLQEHMSIHRFIRSYYLDELQKDRNIYDAIAKEYGEYAFNKCISLYERLIEIYEKDGYQKGGKVNAEVEWLSNEVFRYAIPADRLLRSVNNSNLADQIPTQLRVKGTLRELVFFFYEEVSDYEKAAYYAEKWLEINPNDYRVKLFLARCHRNFRDANSLNRAERIVDELEEVGRLRKRQPRAELYRERALIADFRGNEALAIDYFLEGIHVDKYGSYTENYTGIAMIYIRQADRLPEGIPDRTQKIKDALDFLEFARNKAISEKRDSFDLYHLGTYAEALVLDGQDEIAFPLLQQALENRPHDARLKYWLAEMYRKNGELDIAEEYAKDALTGETKAAMTLANISRTRSQKESSNQRRVQFLEKALVQLEQFMPQYGSGHEVKATVKSQILRELERLEEALEAVKQFATTSSPYLIQEHCLVLLSLAKKFEIVEHNPAKALLSINNALTLARKVKDGRIIDMDATMSMLYEEEKRLERLIN